jgi:hypothetical protein
MSLCTLETEITVNARVALCNPKLRLKDIREWSTGEVKPEDGEIVIHLDHPGVNVAYLKACDKRKAVP